jgi:hypothetical protein
VWPTSANTRWIWRRYPARDLVELEVGGVFVVDDARRILIQAPSQRFRGGALMGHGRG